MSEVNNAPKAEGGSKGAKVSQSPPLSLRQLPSQAGGAEIRY
ncbi:hypothetical protein HPSSW114_0083 [Glaesserella parasuis SW114]|nr:hypothetical protein HPSSW114_0083 [Glaesserella parasuis SW114]